MPVEPCYNSEEKKPGYKVKNSNGCPYTYTPGNEESRKEAKRKAYIQMNAIYKSKAENIARAFHESYERLAPDFNYETRESSRTTWENIPENNKMLMIATVMDLLDNGVI